LSDILKAIYREPIAVAQKITENEVFNAIKKVSPDKPPGPDTIFNKLFKKCGKTLVFIFQRLFTVYLKFNYHPQSCKQSIIIILRKEKKPDYSKPKTYRPIALLNTLGKTLKGIIAERIIKTAEDNQLLSPT
jgi:hypothetical protein